MQKRWNETAADYEKRVREYGQNERHERVIDYINMLIRRMTEAERRIRELEGKQG